MVSAEEFYQRYANQKKPYKCIRLQTHLAHIQFSGMFEQQRIIWNATIKTLKSIALHTPTNEIQYLRQFIHLQTTNDNLIPITIALNVNSITKPVINKTIIMINNYKLLKIGKHEYGERISFD